jgi:hypothetical protein
MTASGLAAPCTRSWAPPVPDRGVVARVAAPVHVGLGTSQSALPRPDRNLAMHPHPRSLQFLTLAVVLVACSDGTGPTMVPRGTFTLRTYNGQSMPAVLASQRFADPATGDSGTYRQVIAIDNLYLKGEGRDSADFAIASEWIYDSGADSSVMVGPRRFAIQVSRTELCAGYTCSALTWRGDTVVRISPLANGSGSARLVYVRDRR